MHNNNEMKWSLQYFAKIMIYWERLSYVKKTTSELMGQQSWFTSAQHVSGCNLLGDFFR